jgi:MFS family permease
MIPDSIPVANTDDDRSSSSLDPGDQGPVRPGRLVFGFPDERYGPLIAAVILGWISAPFAALSIIASSSPVSTAPGSLVPLTFLQALSMAFVAVTAAALVGGLLGGALVRRRPVLGFATALFVAWPVAIATLPLLPSLVGWPYRGAMLCISACNAMLSADAPLSGFTAYAQTLVGDLWGPGEVAGILAVVAIVLARTGHRLFASAFVIATFLGVNFWSAFWNISQAAPVAAIALIVGSIVWVAPYWKGRAEEGTPANQDLAV